MFGFLGKILGYLFNFIYHLLEGIGQEPANFSFLAMTIILTTIVVKLLTLPLQISSTKKMKKTADLQPQVKEIQKKFKHDPQAANMKIMELYKANGASMTGGCLPMLIQFPILIAFFQVTANPQIYAFKPEFYNSMSKTFFWIGDLTQKDPLLYGLPLLAAVLTFLTTLTVPKPATPNPAQDQMKIMNYIFPFMTFYFAMNYAAGLALYWTVSSAFQLIQQTISNKVIRDEEVKVIEENSRDRKNS